MNKLRFEARVLDLYSVDYEYLQDEIEAQGRKILRQTLQNPGTAMVIKGFKLRVSPSDDSKMQVYHDGTWSSAISSIGRLVETENNIDLIAASDNTAGVTNYVYIRSSTGYGTYNKSSGLVEMGVQLNIDYHDFQQVYDREVDVWSIVVYTADEVNALTSESYANLIPLGNFVAAGGATITQVSTSGRIDARTFIADGSIDTGMISESGMELPQTNVARSVTYDDTFSGTPADLEDDLNRIRYFIREIKGTDRWDDFLANNLSVFDAVVNDLHDNGVMQGVRSDFEIIPNSTGLGVLVRGGKALLEGVIEGIPNDEYALHSIDSQAAYFKYDEIHVVSPSLQVQLYYPHVTGYTVGTAPGLTSYLEGISYNMETSSGLMTIIPGAGISVGETLHISYYYGFERYDLIEIGPDHDTNAIKGVSATSTGRIPSIPDLTDGYLPLGVVKIYPHLNTIPSSNIKIHKSFVPKVRNLYFTRCTDVGELGYQLKKMTYHLDTDNVDAGNTQWSFATYDSRDAIISSTVGSYITTSIFISENGELWLMADRNIWTANIDVEWETSTGSVGFDASTSIDLKWRYESRYVPLLIATDLPEGFHRVKVTVTAASGNIVIYGFLSGKSSIRHTAPHVDTFETIVNNILVEAGTRNIGIGESTITSGVTGTDNIAIGYNALKDTATGNYNVAIGRASLRDNTYGDYNVAVGYHTLRTNISGAFNTAVGYTALYSNTAGTYNVALGHSALYSNTVGAFNIALGYRALVTNTTNSYNIAIGREALEANTGGVHNLAMCYQALTANTNGDYNIALGYVALSKNLTGNQNIAIGYNAMLNTTRGDYNIGIGRDALKNHTSGAGNVGVGYQALNSVTSGNRNTGIGYLASNTITTGSDNTSIGYNAGTNITTGSDNICIGHNSGGSVSTASRTIVIGSSLTGANGSDRCYIGNIYSSSSTAAANVVVGSDGRLYRDTNPQKGVPIGTIVAWHPYYYTTSDNSGTRYDASPAISLPNYWQECDGTVVANSASPMYASGTGHVPKINDARFLSGTTATYAGVAGGSNNISTLSHTVGAHNHVWYQVGGKATHNIGIRVISTADYDGFSYNAAGSQIAITHVSAAINTHLYTGNATPTVSSHTFTAGANRPQYFTTRFIIRTF